MYFIDHIQSAFRNIWANKLRTFLTTLGILIGIVSVTVMLSFGDSLEKSVLSSMQGETGILTVMAGNGGYQSSGRNIPLNTQDRKALTTKIPNVKIVTAYKSDSAAIIWRKQNKNGNLFSVEPNFYQFKGLETQSGRWFNSYDFTKKNVVLGKKIAEKIFKSESPIGKSVQIKNRFFTVIGVISEKNAPQWNSLNDAFFIPFPIAKSSLYGSDDVSEIKVKVSDITQIETTRKELMYQLIKKRQIGDLNKLDFQVRSAESEIKSFKKISNALNLFLGGIGAISLIVGGIGVMNIMIVSVTERTKEVGIRKALGAQNKDILLQFLFESIILCLIGAAIGIMISFGIIYIANTLLSGMLSSEGLGKISLSVKALTISVSAAIFIGVFFGIFPARKAAKLNPIDALRYE